MKETGQGFAGGIYVLLISVALSAGLIFVILQDRNDDARQGGMVTGQMSPAE